MPKWPSTEFNWSVNPPGAAMLQPTDQPNEIALTTLTGSPTSFTLDVHYQNTVLSCEGSAKTGINILPQGAITGDDLFCEDDNRSYTIAGGYPANWVLRDATNTVVATGAGTTFNHTFSIPGSYKLSATGSAFCPPEDFLITVVPTPPPPDTLMGPDRACAGIPIKYEAGNPLPGLTYLWSVSSGSTNSDIGDISYITFAGSPNYTVSVQRRTTEGAACLSTPLQMTVMAPLPPLVITGPDTVCHSTTVSYSVNADNGDLYEWKVLPPTLGSVVSGGNTPHPDVLWNVPASPGQMAILQLQITKCSVPTITTKNVYVRGIPVITSITWGPTNPICSGVQGTLTINTNTSINSGSYTINWGDGLTTNGTFSGGASLPVNHTYNNSSPGSTLVFHPAVTIIDPNGCIVKITDTAPAISVYPSPVAFISPSGTIYRCIPFSETLTATETTGMAGSNSFTWTTPSGSASGSVISATAYGAYQVTVTNSLHGCSNTSAPLYIVSNCGGSGGIPGGSNPPGCGPPPTVNLNVTENCGSFTITTSMSGGTWSLQGGPNPAISYTPSGNMITGTAMAAGKYTFIYVLRNPLGSLCEYFYYADLLVPYTADLRYSMACNQANSNYTITLFDHSTQYPLTPITGRNYYSQPGMVWIGSGISASVNQASGTTVTYLEVIDDGGAHPPCTSSLVLTTPVFPSVNVTDISPYNPGCVNDVVFSFNQSTTGTITSYWWDFGDFSTNASSQSSIGKVYVDPLPYTASLTVKDDYGCAASDNVNVTVVDNPYHNSLGGNLDGHFMTALPTPVCKGSPVTLTYMPGTNGYPGISYTWYNQEHPLYTTYPPTYSFDVYESGGYWVRATDHNGCVSHTAKLPLGPVPVDVIVVPPVSVSGNSRQCVDQPFTLRTQDYGAGYTYLWSDGVTTGTSLTTTLSAPGNYNYTVTITDVASGCSFVSPVFTVTVSPPPAPPSLSYSVLSCNPYQLQLTATGPAGTYNWSNGMSGNPIITPHGGPYQVTVTDLNGCRVQNSFFTPSSLEEYIWIFPTGCFCDQLSNSYLIGPIIPFVHWEWLENGAIVSTGSGYVLNYSPLLPGSTYNLMLHDGNCTLFSGDMYYNTDTCKKIKSKPADITEAAAPQNTLTIAPNPAGNRVAFTYRFVPGARTRSIQVVDMMGHSLRSFAVHNDSGKVEMPLDGLATGVYRVLMRRDGAIVRQQQLVVDR